MNGKEKSYFDLTEHNATQVIVFVTLFIISVISVFHGFLPLINEIVTEFLKGEVVNNGKRVPFDSETPNVLRVTNYYTAWAVDIYKGTRQEVRYWFNPVLSLAIPSILISILVSVGITSLLPRKAGIMRQKIERELVYILEKISFRVNGYHSTDERKEIVKEILSADLRDFHDLREKWGFSVEDLKKIHAALKWREGNFITKVLNLNQGLSFYMRFYFTERFGNTILGMVYIGAAVLIIIIGLRGLKFIPSTQPSLVFFALGLEFSLLLTYAFTLMFTKNEEDSKDDESSSSKENLFLSNDFGNTKEVEKLLRVFIKSDKPTDNN